MSTLRPDVPHLGRDVSSERCRASARGGKTLVSRAL